MDKTQVADTATTAGAGGYLGLTFLGISVNDWAALLSIAWLLYQFLRHIFRDKDK